MGSGQQPVFRVAQELQDCGIQPAFEQGEQGVNVAAACRGEGIELFSFHGREAELHFIEFLCADQGCDGAGGQLNIQHAAMAQQGAPRCQAHAACFAESELLHPGASPEVSGKFAGRVHHGMQRSPFLQEPGLPCLCEALQVGCAQAGLEIIAAHGGLRKKPGFLWWGTPA